MSKTKIEWCDESWNPVTGCTPISDGCKNCYAQRLAKRLQAMGQANYKNGFKVACHKHMLGKVPRGSGKAVFVCSMSDLFHERVRFKFIANVFDRMLIHDQHTYLLLTKRPQRALKFTKWFNEYYDETPWGDHIALGVTVENQAMADERIPLLLQIPAAKRFISCEPLLGPVEVNFIGCPHCGQSRQSWFPNYTICESCRREVKSPPDNMISGVIVGGESGPCARPMHPDWARSLRDQCDAADVPFFFKQWGKHTPFVGGLVVEADGGWCDNRCIRDPHYGNDYTNPTDVLWMSRTGKKKAGRLLDGREHNDLPWEVKKND